MAQVLSFPETKRLTLPQPPRSIDAACVDAQLSDLTSKLSRLKIDDANHDHAAAIFVISLALSHAHTAMQLISDVSLKQQLENKLHEVDELLRAASAKNAKL